MVDFLNAIAEARSRGGKIVFLGPGSADELSWSEFFGDAERTAAWLQESRGIGPGSRVVVLALPSRAMATTIAAVWLAGGTVTCAPTPTRTTDLGTFAEQTRGRIAILGDPLVVVGDPFRALVDELVAGGLKIDLLADVVTAVPCGVWKAPDLAPDDVAILQFTSGTTAAPKVARVSHSNLSANIAAIRDRYRHEEVHGRTLSWLPLSHDMGLVGAFAVQLTCGHCDLVLGSPVDYLAAPASWMYNAARYRATVLVAPASAYAMAGRLLAVEPTLDLSSVRVAMCGGEPIEPGAIEGFLESAARHGFRREAFLPAYGLAEATLAVAMPAPFTGLRVDEIDPDVLGTRHEAVPATKESRSRRLARLGPPVGDLQIRIVDPETGAACPDRAVGEIHIHGRSVTTIHTDHGADQVTSTYDVRRSADGWLATGDLGYLADGELVVCGRAKDLIIIGGRNIHPEEIEQAAGRVEGVRPGNTVAFSTRRGGVGTVEGVGVAVELRAGHDAEAIRAGVIAEVLSAVGIRPDTVRVLPPGSIPKTPSGKLQRAEAARLFGGPR